MNHRRAPLLVVSLPGRTLDELRTQLALARGAGGDVAEIRLDRIENADRPRLAELFPSPLPLLVTYRSRQEGGLGAEDPATRRSILLDAAKLPFAWVDLESDRDGELLHELPSTPHREVILSTHLLAETSRSELARRFREPVPSGAMRKVVVAASIGHWLKNVAPSLPPPGEVPLLVSATGPAGPLSRAWAKRLKLPAIFTTLPTEGAPAGTLLPVEPSQLPVDRVRRFVDAEGDPPLFGIAGHPVAHSRSPELHARWMRTEGHAGLYVPIDFTDDAEFLDALPALAAGGFRGLNVTHPFKSAALGAASRVSRAAELCGVANCLTFLGDEVEAQNTDLAAILRRLSELRRLGRWNGSSLDVIGAGGAARATLAAARELTARARVFARRPEAAAEVARAFGATVGDWSTIEPSSLVIQATPVGRGDPGPVGIPMERLIGPSTHVLDWVYAPDTNTVRATAETRGGTYEDGWRLLVYQAAASYGIWWDEEPSEREVTRAVEERT